MSTPMLNNLMAAFKPTDPSPLYGLPLHYLVGSTAPNFRVIPGSVIEAPHRRVVIGEGPKIAYLDMRGDIASQVVLAAANDFSFAELDHAEGYGVGKVQETITAAHGFGVAVIAKNPHTLAIVAHPNVQGIIAEPGAGSPGLYDDLRHRARKDGLLPVWFVFAGGDGAIECAKAITAAGYKGMGVSYSTGQYTDSHTVLTPIL